MPPRKRKKQSHPEIPERRAPSSGESIDDIQRAWSNGEMDYVAPDRPSPLAHALMKEPLPVSQHHLRNLFRRFFKRLPPERRAELVIYIDEVLQNRWTVGTACSGTDGPLLAWDAFSAVLSTDMGCDLNVEHKLTAEKEVQKQAFLLKAFPDTPRVFDECLELPAQSAHDVVSGAHHEADTDIHVVQAGFPCTDMSKLHKDTRLALPMRVYAPEVYSMRCGAL